MVDIPHEWVRECQEGNVQAFADIVGACEKPLLSFVYRLLYNSPSGRDPEDVVQEIFLKAYVGIGKFDLRREKRFDCWLFAVARNHCISLLRRRRAEDEATDLGEDGLEGLADTASPDPREALWERDVSRRVADTVSALPEKLKSAFILRHYEGMSYQDVAAVMGCRIGTAKSRVARARETLARELEGLSVAP